MTTWASHLPMLLIVTPLVGAALMPVVAGTRPRVAHALVGSVTALTALMSWALLGHAASEAPVRYAVAGWPGPWGIELLVDRPGAFVAAVVATVSALSIAWARRLVTEEHPTRVSAYYAVALLILTGLLGMCLTGDAFNLFVFLEVTSLAGYALVASGSPRARVAAFRYLILGATGASLYLLGVGYLYAGTGTLNLAELAQRVPSAPLAPVALGFIVTGLALKMGLFPLHAWMPDAYAESSPSTAAFIAPVVTKVMAFSLLRFVHAVFGEVVRGGDLPLGPIIAWTGAAAVLVGSAMAAAQRDLRRLLAWSSVGQIGYLAMGIGIGTPIAVAAALLHVLNHALMKALLFYVAGASGARTLADLKSLSARMPVSTGCLVIAGLSMVGIPPLGGFFSKWYLLQGALQAGELGLVAAILGGSVLAIVYVFRVLEAACVRSAGAASEAPLSMLAPMAATAIGIVAAGLFSERIVSMLLSRVSG